MCRVPLQSRGVSLLELMMSLSILAILGGLAAPAFSGMWLDAKRTTAVNTFVHSVFLARSTAVQTGQTVTICRSIDALRASAYSGRR